MSCILFDGPTTKRGYGRSQINGRRMMAHRRAWEEVHGPVPKGMVLHHDCETKLCVNVDHLRLITQREHGAEHQRRHRERGCPKCGGPLSLDRNGKGVLALRCRECRR